MSVPVKRQPKASAEQPSHSITWEGPDPDMDLEDYALSVNGQTEQVRDAWVGESLLYVLRERLGLPGSKDACEQGECGACSIFLDGVLVCSCCVLGVDAVDSEIVTIEGIPAQEGHSHLSNIQKRLVDAGAIQCGFCTPGLVVAIHDLLKNKPRPSQFEIREAISGNLCRCTGYARILQAVQDVMVDSG